MESNPSPSSASSIVPKIVAGVVAVLVCCACIAILAAGVIIYQAYQQAPVDIPPVYPTLEPPATAPIPTLDQTPIESISSNTLETLNQTLVPENDPYELACRLKGICDVPRTVLAKSYQIGDKEQF